jgi:hypothetical protein
MKGHKKYKIKARKARKHSSPNPLASILLALALVASMLPTAALAEVSKGAPHTHTHTHVPLLASVVTHLRKMPRIAALFTRRTMISAVA